MAEKASNFGIPKRADFGIPKWDFFRAGVFSLSEDYAISRVLAVRKSMKVRTLAERYLRLG